ncbi:MAG: RNA pyrophosphohydrolase [Rhodoblastus sp.]|nr:MAG: RNA pyrophosphohydrolase [Rhodoblastus sp.]
MAMICGPLPSRTPHEGYRACVGALLVAPSGGVFVGRRRDKKSASMSRRAMNGRCRRAASTGEAPYAAALRELYEETNIRSVALIGEAPAWFAYDLPDDVAGQAWGGKFRGQTQKWFALRFSGEEAEIDVLRPGGAHKPEFDAWRWARLSELPDLIIPFKRPVYERVVEAFAPLLEG